MATDYNAWISSGGSPMDFWNQQSQGGNGADITIGPGASPTPNAGYPSGNPVGMQPSNPFPAGYDPKTGGGLTSGPGNTYSTTPQPTASPYTVPNGMPGVNNPGGAYTPGGTNSVPYSPGSPTMNTPGAATNPYAAPAAPSAPGAPSPSATPGAPSTSPSTYFPGTQAPTSNPFGGSNPYLANPTGTGPNGTYNFNQTYFPTQNTAQMVAQMVGGTVAPGNNILSAPNSPFTQNQPNYMAQTPDGRLINPGTIANYYQTYSDPSQANLLKQLVQGELSGQGLGNVGYNPALANNAVQMQDPRGAPITNQFTPTFNPFTLQPTQGNTAAPQQQQQSYTPQAPFDFGSLVSQLYGSNPFSAATGSNMLGSLLASASGGQSMSSIASLLNSLFSQRTQTNNSALSPLFWNSQQASPLSNFYPAFY